MGAQTIYPGAKNLGAKLRDKAAEPYSILSTYPSPRHVSRSSDSFLAGSMMGNREELGGISVGEVNEVARLNPRQLIEAQRARQEESQAAERERKSEAQQQQKQGKEGEEAKKREEEEEKGEDEFANETYFNEED